MNYLLEEGQLRQIIKTAAEQGAKHILVLAGLEKTEITKTEAYRRFSRRKVDNWIKEGDIIPTKRGKTSYLQVLEIEALSQTNDLYSKHLQETG